MTLTLWLLFFLFINKNIHSKLFCYLNIHKYYCCFCLCVFNGMRSKCVCAVAFCMDRIYFEELKNWFGKNRTNETEEKNGKNDRHCCQTIIFYYDDHYHYFDCILRFFFSCRPLILFQYFWFCFLVRSKEIRGIRQAHPKRTAQGDFMKSRRKKMKLRSIRHMAGHTHTHTIVYTNKHVQNNLLAHVHAFALWFKTIRCSDKIYYRFFFVCLFHLSQFCSSASTKRHNPILIGQFDLYECPCTVLSL